MLQRNTDKIFMELSKMFCIAGDILIPGYKNNATDYDRTLNSAPDMQKGKPKA